MSLSYTFYIYINNTIDLENICTIEDTLTVPYQNYDLNACLFKNLPQQLYPKYTGCTSIISPCVNNNSMSSNYCFTRDYNMKNFGQNSIPFENPPLSSCWPVNSLPGGISDYESQNTSYDLSLISGSYSQIKNNRFVTFRNSTISETSSNPTIGFWSSDNGVSHDITVSGTTYSFTFYSKTTCSTSIATVNNYYEQNSNTANFFYINNDTSTEVNSLPMKYYSQNPNVPYQTSGIGVKYFFPALGTTNPPSVSSSNNPSGKSLDDYPLGTKFVSPYESNSSTTNSSTPTTNSINSFVLPQVSAEVLGICCPGGSNLLTGLGYYAYGYVYFGYVDTSQAYVSLDLMHFGTPTLVLPLYQLKDPYTTEPTIQNDEYINPFLNKPRTNSYYSYGIFSNPTVQLVLGEQLPNATEYTPSALFSVTYTIQESDLQNPDNLYSIMDLLNFYNNLYSYANTEFTSQKISANFDYPVNMKQENSYGSFKASYSNMDSPVYSYYQESCESAKRLIIDYCLQSKNMGNPLCSAPIIVDGVSENLNLPNLKMGQYSPCRDPFSNCQESWSSYCQNTSNCLNTYCEAYFTSGYVDNATYLDESIQIELRNVCSNFYENAPMSTPSPDGVSSKILPENFYTICGCYLPDSVYQKYLNEYYVSGQPLGSNQCWYMPCATSSTAPVNSNFLKCPDTAVATCVQQSYLDLKTNGGNIENNDFTVNQTIKKCSTESLFKEGTTPQISSNQSATMDPTNYNFNFNEVEGGLSGSIKIPFRYFPRGFVLTVLFIFGVCFCLVLFG